MKRLLLGADVFALRLDRRLAGRLRRAADGDPRGDGERACRSSRRASPACRSWSRRASTGFLAEPGDALGLADALDTAAGFAGAAAQPRRGGRASASRSASRARARRPRSASASSPRRRARLSARRGAEPRARFAWLVDRWPPRRSAALERELRELAELAPGGADPRAAPSTSASSRPRAARTSSSPRASSSSPTASCSRRPGWRIRRRARRSTRCASACRASSRARTTTGTRGARSGSPARSAAAASAHLHAARASSLLCAWLVKQLCRRPRQLRPRPARHRQPARLRAPVSGPRLRRGLRRPAVRDRARRVRGRAAPGDAAAAARAARRPRCRRCARCAAGCVPRRGPNLERGVRFDAWLERIAAAARGGAVSGARPLRRPSHLVRVHAAQPSGDLPHDHRASRRTSRTSCSAASAPPTTAGALTREEERDLEARGVHRRELEFVRLKKPGQLEWLAAGIRAALRPTARGDRLHREQRLARAAALPGARRAAAHLVHRQRRERRPARREVRLALRAAARSAGQRSTAACRATSSSASSSSACRAERTGILHMGITLEDYPVARPLGARRAAAEDRARRAPHGLQGPPLRARGLRGRAAQAPGRDAALLRRGSPRGRAARALPRPSASAAPCASAACSRSRRCAPSWRARTSRSSRA